MSPGSSRLLGTMPPFKNFLSSPGFISFKNGLHITSSSKYPKAAVIRLPDNFQDINASETGCFSPLRSREYTTSFIESLQEYKETQCNSGIDVTLPPDPHVGPYDCRGAVSLSSSMQSNVPSPFGGDQSILNMPGSQWGQGYKYLSDHLHSHHYLTLRNKYARNRSGSAELSGTYRLYNTLAKAPHNGGLFNSGYISLLNRNKNSFRTMTNTVNESKIDNNKSLSRKEQLKQAVAAYGSTVIVFHVTISLASLGCFYLLVSSGLDVAAWVSYLGFANDALTSKVTTNAGTFVVAYAVHKVFAPVRIGITLTATPFIVRYLRKIGILKNPKK